jgi:tetratricopeptide (TPR) repeat protein
MLGTVAPDHDAAGKRYAEGYGLARDATKDLADGQPERARKKFGKARKLFERATQLDARYYQAWNMLGYSARQCGDLQAALAAYGKCLEIAPEYADAHEYLGETYLKTGEIEKAKAELAWLRARKSAQADILAGKIAQAESGGGDAGKSADDWKGGASDSTGAREK